MEPKKYLVGQLADFLHHFENERFFIFYKIKDLGIFHFAQFWHILQIWL